jgi:hypothetical protein
MAWIESHQSLSAHPKTRKAARALGITVPHLMGHLHCLWHRALDIAEDGDLSKFDNDDIAILAEWDGDAADFVLALVNCGPGDSPGFLERDGPCGDPEEQRTGALVLHDWWEYAGKLIARRRKDRQRKAHARSEGQSEDVQGTSEGSTTDAPQDGRLVGSVGHGSVGGRSGKTVASEADEQFETFWQAYPRGSAGKPGGDGPKKPALQAFRRLKASDRAACLVAVDHYREHIERPDAPHAAHAVTWLRQERWQQWSEPASKPANVRKLEARRSREPEFGSPEWQAREAANRRHEESVLGGRS